MTGLVKTSMVSGFERLDFFETLDFDLRLLIVCNSFKSLGLVSGHFGGEIPEQPPSNFKHKVT
jgi:hypothetical protein